MLAPAKPEIPANPHPTRAQSLPALAAVASRSCASSTEVTAEQVARHDRPGPRYTSYPSALSFHTGFGPDDYSARLAEAARRTDEPLSLYLHLPFCPRRCSFCGCNVIITRRQDVIDHYVDRLIDEIHLVAARLGERRGVMQYHWGGGTPTHLSPAQIRRLHAAVTGEFRLLPGAEVAIEVDPRLTTFEHLTTLRELGWNRLSLGVQDTDAGVQHEIGRDQTFEQTERVHRQARQLGFASISFDLVYGLPGQTRQTFERTIDQVIELGPDRIACYSFALVPWMRSNQKAIDVTHLPPRPEKLALYLTARERLTRAGYLGIGMDHFARPGDELAVALGQGRLSRNFMGYTVVQGTDLVGLGPSSIGQVAGAYAQDTKKLSEYFAHLDAGRPPTERGYALTAEDQLRGRVIRDVMCRFRVDFAEVEQAHGVVFAEHFAAELAELASGPARELVEVGDTGLVLTELGHLFARNVAMAFDAHLPRGTAERPRFSGTV
jgi:oxygen-independent coproporphyrinogen-3 oxidase